MASERILVVEDDPDIFDVILHNLRKAGYRPQGVRTGHEGLSLMSDERIDLAILDVMLPDITGTEVCRRMRESERMRSIPVLLLTARAEEHDRIYGFSLGADDYLTKPFSPREMVARAQAILRRTTGSIMGRNIVVDDLVIDLDRRQVRIGARPVSLTFKEFEVLRTLVVAKGRAVERMQILEEVWGMDSTSGPRSVDVTVTRLRDKLKPFSRSIHTVTGMGYQWDPDRVRQEDDSK